MDYQEVELFISCRNLVSKDTFSKSDPYISVELQTGNEKKKLGKTESLNNNSNPNFSKTFIFNYIFEIKQLLILEVYDKDDVSKDDLISKFIIPVGTIAGSRNQVSISDLKSSSGKNVGKIILKLDQIKHSIYHIFWQWQGIKIKDVDFGFWDKSDPFLRFYRSDKEVFLSKINNFLSKEWLMIHETEYILDNLNPIFKPFTIDIARLCKDNYDAPIKVECYDWQSNGKHRLIGETLITMNEIVKQNKTEFIMTHKKYKKPGSLKIAQHSIIEKYSFMDYLQGGIQLNMMVAIDFTGSNGRPDHHTSLHYLGEKNQYRAALAQVCDILLEYDYDKKVPLFGFGAVPQGQPTVNHCFPLTRDDNNFEVYGLQGILEFYEKTIHTCKFSGPTYFSQILTKAMQFSEYQQQFGVYTILLILTDGEIHDMDGVIQLLIKSAKLPLSVIIIGIGDEKFEKMEILDGDEGLKGAGSDYRDLVQFVKFQKYSHNLPKLAEKVLAELPNQLVYYMKRQGIKPAQPKNIQMSQVQI